jgi:hypothetical protein
MHIPFISRPLITKDDLPDRNELDQYMNRAFWTPDMYMLEQYQWQLLFVPDEVQRGGLQYDLIRTDSVFRGHAWTRHPFEFWLKELGDQSYPIPMETKNTTVAPRYWPTPGKIMGEVHSIRPYLFRELDRHKLNGVQFFRRRVPLIFPYRQLLLQENKDRRNTPLPLALRGKKGAMSPEIVYIMRAWMYIGIPKYWRPLLKMGERYSSVQQYESKQRSWARPYYRYRRRVTL